MVHPVEALDRAFPLNARIKGAEYHRNGAVRLLAGDARTVRAEVRGGRGFQAVTIRLDRGRVSLSCSCPTFREQAACQHLWATLLLARDRGALAGALAEAPLASPDELPLWRRRLEGVRQAMERDLVAPPTVPPAVAFTLDVTRTCALGELAGTIEEAVPPRNAGKSTRRAPTWRPLRLSVDAIAELPDPIRQLLALLEGATTFATGAPGSNDGSSTDLSAPLSPSFTIPGALAQGVLSRIAEAGVLRVRADDAPSVPAALQIDPPYRFVLVLERDEESDDLDAGLLLRGELRRPLQRPEPAAADEAADEAADNAPEAPEECIDVGAPLALTASGWALFADRITRCELAGAARLAAQLRDHRRLVVPRSEETALWESLSSLPALPPFVLGPGISVSDASPVLEPRLKLEPVRSRLAPASTAPARYVGRLSFSYDGVSVSPDDRRAAVFVPARKLLVRRSLSGEAAALDRLDALGAEPIEGAPGASASAWPSDLQTWELGPRTVPSAVRTLVSEGWRVEADGKRYRRATEARLQVRSGIDWFDLDGGAEFGGTFVPLPQLLAAVQNGDDSVPLPDGSLGLLPEGWLPRQALLTALGHNVDGRLRFSRAQAGLLDVLLADSEIAVDADEAFSRARRELANFERVEPLPPPPGFVGTLRPYQEMGLGWFAFLRRFGLGGCLADDMGLGKTVQVLALLEARRQMPDDKRRPSLVVVPRSLLWNWEREAARFAPSLRVRVHHGPDRTRDAAVVAADVDLLVTTYGTLRNDAPWMSAVTFDYAILDEAQAVKNPASASAKGARLLRADHRLALSGTPIENHLDELWSLFEFLNPGLLGSVSAFQGLLEASSAEAHDHEALARLAAVLRPFFLRRTKEQVARDLPEKREELLVCEMDVEQRRLYDELRDHYRATLLGGGKGEPGTMHVLEALLRLRQAACHPALVDASRAAEDGAKLEVLLPRIAELRESGHKALVFSQFTSFLAIVRARLDAAGIPYEYLDGRTRDRGARVERFQNDPECPVFLVSLKAGGVGLNLTAADYVFLLDPWWNPAAEAQAVDRAHRIGQQRPVIVYRLVCRDTVEEKVLELQRSKRALADAVLGDDAAAARTLDRESLAALLG